MSGPELGQKIANIMDNDTQVVRAGVIGLRRQFEQSSTRAGVDVDDRSSSTKRRRASLEAFLMVFDQG